MRCVLFVLMSCLGSSALAGAQVVDPSGHWEGSVQLPAMEIAVQVDFQRAPDGTVAGAIGVPAQHLTGLPLTRITFDGRAMTFGARSDQVLSGALSEDRQSISGDFRMEGVTAAFTLTRTGEARIAPPPKSAAIRPDFWVNGRDPRGRRRASPRADARQRSGWHVAWSDREPRRGRSDDSHRDRDRRPAHHADVPGDAWSLRGGARSGWAGHRGFIH